MVFLRWVTRWILVGAEAPPNYARAALLRTGTTHQNHSLPKLGTEKTPQWMKMPNFAWSYQPGSGRESMDSQVGWYLLWTPLSSGSSSSARTAGKAPIPMRTVQKVPASPSYDVEDKHLLLSHDK